MIVPRARPRKTHPRPRKAERIGSAVANPTKRKATAAARDSSERRRDLTICVRRVGARAAADESVTHTDHSFDAVAARVQFLAQPANVHVQGARVAVITVPPNLIAQLLAGDDPILFPGERRQQLEFLMR